MDRKSLNVLIFIFLLVQTGVNAQSLTSESLYLKWILLPSGEENPTIYNKLVSEYGTETHVIERIDSTQNIIKSKRMLPIDIPHGKQLQYHDGRMQVKSIQNYVFGRLNGKAIEYHTNGELKSEYEVFYGDTISGKEFDAFGFLELETRTDSIHLYKDFYKNGIKVKIRTYSRLYKYLDGNTTEFHLNGNVKVDANFFREKLDGLLTSYFPNGTLENKVNFNKGIKHGEEITFYKNGKIKLKASYAVDLLNGEYILYYANGQVEKSVNYVYGDKQGIEKTFLPNGSMISEINYENNIENGPYKLYHKNVGVVFESGKYENGYKHGMVDFFSIDGKKVSSIEYNFGKRVAEKYNE